MVHQNLISVVKFLSRRFDQIQEKDGKPKQLMYELLEILNTSPSKTDFGQIYVKESLIQHNAILFSNLLAYLEKFKFKFMHTESVIFTEVIYLEYYPTGFSPGRV